MTASDRGNGLSNEIAASDELLRATVNDPLDSVTRSGRPSPVMSVSIESVE